MAQFLSDLFTLTTISVAGGAAVLGNVSLAPLGTPDQVEMVEIAALQETADMLTVTTIRQAADVEAAPVKKVQKIRRAELHEVVFTGVGSDSGLRASVPQRLAGVVTGNTVNIRSGPGTGNPVIGQGRRGDELAVTGRTDGLWIEVVLNGSSQAGWIHGKFFDAPEAAQLASN